MTRRNVSKQRLDYLLKNWGAWERSAGRLGPIRAVTCGSAERLYAVDKERHVWEGRTTILRDAPEDEELAEQTEEALLSIPVNHQRLIVLRYAKEFSLEKISERLGMSLLTAEARLDAAVSVLWAKLEEAAWASGH